jgi:outer membrane receptor protein involved in Fe transport
MKKQLIYAALLSPALAFGQKQDSIKQSIDRQIEAVEIKAKKKLIERKIDRLVFNVDQSIAAAGGDALDALKQTPGLRVQNNQIAMVGKSNMAVFVDDKRVMLSGEDLMNYLRSIASDNIKSIEVITTPPAKYDAEGNSGILNIKLKKARKDYWSTTLRASASQATYLSGRTGLNVAYQQGKFGVLADFGFGKVKQIYTNHQTYLKPNGNYWEAEIYNLTHGQGLAPSLTMTYDFSPKLSMGLQYIGYQSKQKLNEDYETLAYQNQSKNKLDNAWLSNGINNRGLSEHDINFNTRYKLDETGDQKISLDVDYFQTDDYKNNPFLSNNTDFKASKIQNFNTINKNNGQIRNLSIRLDTELPLEDVNLDFGTKWSRTNNSNSVNGQFYELFGPLSMLYLSQANRFDYQEINQAWYVSAQKKIGEKWETKVGLRLEHTQTDGLSSEQNQPYKTEYSKLFPSAYLSYKSNENHQWVADFSRRINRPGYWELNPAKWYQTLNSVTYGNPFLQPSFVYNYTLKHQYKELLSSELSFSDSQNASSQITVSNGDLVESIRLNYFDAQSLNLSESLNYKPLPWWTATLSASLWYQQTKTKTALLLPKYSGWGSFCETTNSFDLNQSKTWVAQLNYSQNLPTKSGEFSISANGSVELGSKYMLLDKQLVIGLSFQNMFRTDSATLSNTVDGVQQSFKQYYDTQLLKLSLSYKFGGKTNIETHEGGNKDEKKRAGN